MGLETRFLRNFAFSNDKYTKKPVFGGRKYDRELFVKLR
jgi:hypothetical protein